MSGKAIKFRKFNNSSFFDIWKLLKSKFCCNLSTQHTIAKNTAKYTGKLPYVDLVLWFYRKPRKGPILITRDYPLKISISNLKQEMLYILTIVVREIMHVCICNLEQSNFDVKHDYLPKIRKLVIFEASIILLSGRKTSRLYLCFITRV